MNYHNYGDSLTEDKITVLKEMAREKDLSVWFLKDTHTFRIMDLQKNRMVANNLSFEDAWAFVVNYEW